MLIDDSKFDNIVNKRLLEMNDLAEEISVCLNGVEAMDYWNKLSKEAISSRSFPEVIFLDINMPLMNGFEFLEAFGQLPASVSEEVKIIMLTSSINPEDEARSVKSKLVSRYLHKPLTVEKLAKLF